jgi:hypothetical protein
VTTFLNILAEVGKIVRDFRLHFLHMACLFGTTFDVVKIFLKIIHQVFICRIATGIPHYIMQV